MVPAVGDSVFHPGTSISIRTFLLLFDGGVREVGGGNGEIGGLVIEDPHEGMAFGNIEEAARFEIPGDDGPPGHQIWEPANDAIGGVDDIELSREYLWKIIDVGVDEG